MSSKNNLIKPMARVVVSHKDEVLVVKRSPGESRPGEWEVPGGAVDPGETFEQGAIRETKEEVGLDVSDLVYDYSDRYQFGGLDRMAVVYRATSASKRVTLSHEHCEYKWVNKDNFNNVELDKNYVQYFRDYFSNLENDQKDANNVESLTTKLQIFTDGGSRGNPGPSATGYVIFDEAGELISEGGEYLGITTNNQAEYQAVRTALVEAQKIGAQEIDFFVDSMLVVKQVQGEWKIKNRDLWPIHESIKDLMSGFKRVTFKHVVREKNKLADGKVNEVLDAHQA